MKIMLSSRLHILALAGAFGFLVGLAANSNPGAPTWHKSFAPRTKNIYKNIDCPSDGQLKSLLENLHLQTKTNPLTCQDAATQKIAKLLYLLHSLKTDLPSDWQGPGKEILRDSDAFMSQTARTFTWDKLQNPPVQNIFGNMIVSPNLGELNPLQALGYLVHQAYHSLSAGHIACSFSNKGMQGELCDPSPRAENHQYGSHVADLSFWFGLSEFGELSDSDREYLRSLALAKLANSFNKLPVGLDTNIENIYALSNKGNLYWVHPFLGRLLLVRPDGLDKADKLVRIEQDLSRHKLLLFTASKKVFLWSPGKRAVAIKIPGQLHEASPLFVNQDGQTYWAAITDTNQVLSSYDRVTWTPFAYQPDTVGITATRILNALGNQSFVLAENGHLFHFDTTNRVPETAAFPQLPAEANAWTYANGGIIGDELYTISDTGELWRASFIPQGKAYVFSWTKDPISELGPATLLKEGIFHRVILAKDGRIFFQSYGENTNSSLRPSLEKDESLLDLAFLSPTATTPELKSFSKACHVSKPVFDPWSGTALGFDTRGQIVFGFQPEDSGLQCLGSRLEHGRAIASVHESLGVAVQGSGGNSSLLRPYSFKTP